MASRLHLGLLTIGSLPLLALSQQITGTYTFPGETPLNFQGFFPEPPTATRVTCPEAQSWLTKGDFAGCCDLGDHCNVLTACQGGVGTWEDGVTAACDTDLQCGTMTIHERFPSGPGVAKWTQYFCAGTWTRHDVYREIVPTPPTTAVRTVTASISATTGASPSGVTSSPTQTPVPTGEPAQHQESESKSMAWVAGPAVGGVVAIVALVGVVFWWGKRRGRRESGGPEAAVSERASFHPGYHHGAGTTPGSDVPFLPYNNTPSPPLTTPAQFSQSDGDLYVTQPYPVQGNQGYEYVQELHGSPIMPR